MKDQFFGAYKLNEKELKDFFKNCQFFFDTNTLLSLYRVKKEMAIRIIMTIAKEKERVCIPYHVGYEYHDKVARHHAKRLTEAQQMQQLCSSSDKLMKKIFSEVFLNYLQKEETGRLREIIQGFSDAVSAFIEEKTSEFNDEFKSMEIAGLLSHELSECLLHPLPPDRIIQLKEEFKERAKKGIPPGYKDKAKANNENCEGATNESGDYIIWTEMMNWASENKKDVLFICNEEKADWIWKEYGLRIGPRRELCDEFKEKTGGRRFHIIKLDTFLSLTNDEYSDKEIREIVEETKPESSHLQKDVVYRKLYNTEFFVDYVSILERIDHIQRDFRERQMRSTNHKDPEPPSQEKLSSDSNKSKEKTNNPLKDPKADKGENQKGKNQNEE